MQLTWSSLVFGTIFAGFTVLWLLYVAGRVDSHDSWWAGPVLVVAGAAGLVAALRPGRDLDELRHRGRDTPPARHRRLVSLHVSPGA